MIPSELLQPVAPGRNIFGMSSWGHAGIAWVAACLNEHPSIYAENASRAAYQNMYGCEIDAHSYMLIAANKYPEKPVHGQVIDYGWQNYLMFNQIYGDRFYGCYFMGHPILRLAGSIDISNAVSRRWKHVDLLNIFSLPPEHWLAQRCLRLFGADADYIPVHYVLRINDMANYINPDAMVRFEELWRSDQAWHDFVMKLSGGTVTNFGDRWRKFEGQYIGMNDGVAHRPLTRDPRDVWESFPQYTRDQVSALLSEQARKFHEELGYDLSFVPNHLDR